MAPTAIWRKMIMSKEKLCTLIIKDMASAKNIIEGLILNGYSSEVTPVQMTYPYTGIAHFALTIYRDESFEE